MTPRRRVAVLISGRGSNMERLAAAAEAADYPATIALVVADQPAAPGLALAQARGIATAVVDRAAYPRQRARFEAALGAAIAAAGAEIICLAGFMRLLSADFCAQWEGRMLNVHPSLLPAFPGLDTHRRALEAGVKLHGCTVHFVTAALDSGPIIAQEAVPVRDGDTPEMLAARVLACEHRLYPAALAALASGRLRIEGARVLGADGIGEPAAAAA